VNDPAEIFLMNNTPIILTGKEKLNTNSFLEIFELIDIPFTRTALKGQAKQTFSESTPKTNVQKKIIFLNILSFVYVTFLTRLFS